MSDPAELHAEQGPTTPATRAGPPPPPPPPRARGMIANASWNSLATLWNIAISFFLTPLLIHTLGTADYGFLLLIWSVTGVLGIVNFGLGEGTLRYVAHYHANGDMPGVNRVFGSTLTFYALVCGVVSVALCAAAPQVAAWLKVPPDQQQTAAWLLRASTLSFTCNFISSGAFAAIPMALQRFDVSSKISMTLNVVRSGGYVVLAMAGFGILHLVVWDVVTQLASLLVQVVVARRLLPPLRLLPSMSLKGLSEIFGYSVSTFVTHIFLVAYRESGKLALGSRTGPASVAYFGTPDSVAYRIYMVLVSGGETLLPRFSATRDRRTACDLLLNATWASVALAVVLLVPLAVVMSDLLRLWISPDFAAHSAAVGQAMALCYVAPAAFVPLATFFRGTGKPWTVTAVMAASGAVALVACPLLIPRYGVNGVGYAYLLSAIPWLAGLVYGWFHAFGRSSLPALVRSAVVPLSIGVVVYLAGRVVRAEAGPLTWFGLLGLGSLLTCVAGVLVFGVDMALGGDSPSRTFIQRVAASSRMQSVVRLLPAGRAG